MPTKTSGIEIIDGLTNKCKKNKEKGLAMQVANGNQRISPSPFAEILFKWDKYEKKL